MRSSTVNGSRADPQIRVDATPSPNSPSTPWANSMGPANEFRIANTRTKSPSVIGELNGKMPLPPNPSLIPDDASVIMLRCRSK